MTDMRSAWRRNAWQRRSSRVVKWYVSDPSGTSAAFAMSRCVVPATPCSAMTAMAASMMRSLRSGSWRRTDTSDLADDPGRVADRDHVGGQVLHDHRARADDGVGADRDAGADDDAAAEPDVVANGDRGAGLPLVAPGRRVDRVPRGQQLHVGGDLHVVADRHPGHVEAHEAEVDEAARAEEGLVPVVELDRRADLGLLAQRGEELGEELAL